MFNKFASILQHAVEAIDNWSGELEPRLAPNLPLQEDFVYHWKSITKYYIDNTDDKRPVDQTNIPSHLEQMLEILIQEEEERGEAGPCMEYLMQHKLLETLHTLGRADCPPGMKQEVLVFFTKLLGKIQQPILPHVNVHRPVHRLIRVCGEVQAAPTENEEIQFLCTLCAKLKDNPYLVNFFLQRDWWARTRSAPPKSESTPSSSPSKGSDSSTGSEGCPEYNIIDSLLSLTQSPDSRIAVKSCEGLMLLVSLPEQAAADCAVKHTRLCEVLTDRLSLLHRALPATMEPIDIESVEAKWGLDFSDKDDANQFPGKRQLTSFLSWLDYCDQLIKESHKTIGAALAFAVKERFFVPVFEPQVMQASEVGALTATALLTQCLKMVTSEHLLHELVMFCLGECRDMEMPGDAARRHKLRHRVIERCDHLSDELSLVSLRLFEVLLQKPHEHVTHSVILANLEERGYYDIRKEDVSQPGSHDNSLNGSKDGNPENQEPASDSVNHEGLNVNQSSDTVSHSGNPGSQDVSETNQQDNQDANQSNSHDDQEHVANGLSTSPPTTPTPVTPTPPTTPKDDDIEDWLNEEKWSPQKDSPTKDKDGSPVHKVVNTFLFLVPDEIKSSSQVEGTGYDMYLRDAHRQFRECCVSSVNWDWPSVVKPLPNCRTDIHFYEGSLVKVLFDKLSRVLDQPYDVNLQVTSVLSKLALLPHPHLHEYMLDPCIPLTPGVRSLHSVLKRVAADLMLRAQRIPDFNRKLVMVRQQLMGMAPAENVDHRTLLEGAIVLEEFCKELAAIAFVKHHATSSQHFLQK
ncbi:FHF complex subunit HOOK interacting protein 2A-like isoform X3 [Branchiostoma lanceolatum]|uniref:FHF complex subunit HOOK interacting protein 2A-like isoform X3 n=1 Tax=Branchiostoma lanceolatum TaxID=7740 RepID=UPI0034517E5A